eukprot:CAMPEP_0194144230 /NCGR_PEP_ID=MMETSP0152-20130528/13306_1 /TAXON_ID=1049557 /ORGANISM="Thalassiothrix antarctica, Strain L6-D1" /LENGTH=185 /DNA_ID=CAMNT_0038843985 /DNA_START=9 /DNA_END=563 /DNA_ORIENTATION=-
MKKNQKENRESEYNGSSIFDFTTISLGSVLVVALGVFLSQVFFLYKTFQDEENQQRRIPSIIGDNRGVRRLIIENDSEETLEQAVANFVDRNEPFVCRVCIKQANLKFWSDDNNLRNVMKDEKTLIPIRSSFRKDDDTTTLFSRRHNVTPNTGESLYQQQDMSFSEFLDVYDQPKDKKLHYYGAQ